MEPRFNISPERLLVILLGEPGDLEPTYPVVTENIVFTSPMLYLLSYISWSLPLVIALVPHVFCVYFCLAVFLKILNKTILLFLLTFNHTILTFNNLERVVSGKSEKRRKC